MQIVYSAATVRPGVWEGDKRWNEPEDLPGEKFIIGLSGEKLEM